MTTILKHSEEKQPKFDKALALFTHVFNTSKLTKVVESREQKEDQRLIAFYEDLSYH
jgi:hypothetical protein